MIEVVGNIWSYLPKNYKIGIPTNIGWISTGMAVMGAGLAKQAVQRYPGLLGWWGDLCRTKKMMTPVAAHPTLPIIAIPTKPLDESHPELSWKQDSDQWIIEGSLMELNELPGDYPIAVPPLGCGCGGLEMRVVIPIMRKYLKSDRFTLVVYPTMLGVKRVEVTKGKQDGEKTEDIDLDK